MVELLNDSQPCSGLHETGPSLRARTLEQQDVARSLDSPMLLDRDQVAAILGVPAETVSYLHRLKKLPACRVGRYCR